MFNHINYATIDGETMLINRNNNKSLMLNESGSIIWNYIIQNKDKEEIVRDLSNIYPNQKYEIERDVNEFFSILRKYGVFDE